MINEKNIIMLIDKAMEAMEYSYAPYSHFNVGAALLTENKKIYQGCNIENAAYTPTNCAERTAFFKAISEGESDFLAICILGGTNGEVKDYTPPCGVCRQVMMEFCNPDLFYVILAINKNDYKIMTLRELFPYSFDSKNLK